MSLFADRAKIFIKSGKGGDGHISFRREMFVAAGGPDGGDGGKGGDIIFEVDKGLNTLYGFRHIRKYIAKDGEPGGKSRCHGANADDLVIKVPEGTVIRDFETGRVISDMSGDNRKATILKGGRGGLGNMNFATATMQVPKYAQPGKDGMELWVQLELKVIADVGLVGFPNVGKSTFLSRTTNARPKIANYHFTTLEPMLGVVKTKAGTSFVMADIPGIIEGASDGVGLGIEFLRHVERTKLLLHVVDVSGSEGRSPVEDYQIINHELQNFSEKLAHKKQIVVANKVDVMQCDTGLRALKELCEKDGVEVIEISAVTQLGTETLVDRVYNELEKLPEESVVEEDSFEEITLETEKLDDTFYVEKVDGEFVVTGKPIERLMKKVNVGSFESLQYLHRVLKSMGVIKELENMGVQEGDTVDILGYKLEYEE